MVSHEIKRFTSSHISTKTWKKMKQVVLRVDDAAFEKFVGMVSLLNRLLERLHQADLKNFGSHLQIVCVASGTHA